MAKPREFLVLVRMANGNVLAVGGEAPAPLAVAEVYTPPCFSGCSVGGEALAPGPEPVLAGGDAGWLPGEAVLLLAGAAGIIALRVKRRRRGPSAARLR